MNRQFQVAGVDGCKAGWFVAMASVHTNSGMAARLKFRLTNVSVASSFAEVFSKTRDCAMDDALDALAAAWTAGQAVLGKAKTLPDQPALDSEGLRMEIVCPIG